VTDRTQEMLSLLEKALELKPEEPETLALLSRDFLVRGDLVQAGRRAHEALTIAPEDHSALVAMGHVLLKQGKIDEAHDHAVWALRQGPTDPDALGLLAAVKAKSSLLMGLWWRYATWMQELGSTKSILVLLFAFILYRIAALMALDFDRPGLAAGVQVAWLALVVYSLVAPQVFSRLVKKELQTVELDKNF